MTPQMGSSMALLSAPPDSVTLRSPVFTSTSIPPMLPYPVLGSNMELLSPVLQPNWTLLLKMDPNYVIREPGFVAVTGFLISNTVPVVPDSFLRHTPEDTGE